MPGPIYQLLAMGHRRLESLLARAALIPGRLDLEAYGEFRAELLRHIGMEENILIPAAQRARRGGPLPMAARLRLDHGALAALLVPPPTLGIVAAIRAILSVHNLAEEGTGGLYETCEELAGDDLGMLTERLRDAPYPRLKPHVSNARVDEATRRALARAGYDFDVLAGPGNH